ncbi:AAA family ATPase [Bacteriovorax sp. PP10]|uniref:AAA family ATPase n=1 Tax=Bacteriovorax antarcticus TaxID=3088717 RepID=A0ABU5W0R0_9BACT|nr:AAA family ATPase [Bacteriovorax sp. PP10]MEA9357845.1 AAA family ATPase [Bacteriovorax sp. PP10]
MDFNIKYVVITGGPGAGKTAVLEMIKKMNLLNTTILPEAASILFTGGFWRLPSKSGRASAQRAIFNVQNEMETLVKEENKWNFALCDRGTLDGLAYWPYDEDLFWKMNHTSLSKELSKYAAIIHLRTPTETQGYNNINPLRIENALTAREIDNKIADIWKDHPMYVDIESYDNFLTKTQIAIDLVNKIMS